MGLTHLSLALQILPSAILPIGPRSQPRRPMHPLRRHRPPSTLSRLPEQTERPPSPCPWVDRCDRRLLARELEPVEGAPCGSSCQGSCGGPCSGAQYSGIVGPHGSQERRVHLLALGEGVRRCLRNGHVASSVGSVGGWCTRGHVYAVFDFSLSARSRKLKEIRHHVRY